MPSSQQTDWAYSIMCPEPTQADWTSDWGHSRVQLLTVSLSCNNRGQFVHTRACLCRRYDLVLVIFCR